MGDFGENMVILNCQKIYLCLWCKDFVEVGVEVDLIILVNCVRF